MDSDIISDIAMHPDNANLQRFPLSTPSSSSTASTPSNYFYRRNPEFSPTGAPSPQSSHSSHLPSEEFHWSQKMEPCGQWNCPLEENSDKRMEECLVCIQDVPRRALLKCPSCKNPTCVICLMKIYKHDQLAFRCPFCRGEFNHLATAQLRLFFRAHKNRIPIQMRPTLYHEERMWHQPESRTVTLDHHGGSHIVDASDPIYETINFDLLFNWEPMNNNVVSVYEYESLRSRTWVDPEEQNFSARTHWILGRGGNTVSEVSEEMDTWMQTEYTQVGGNEERPPPAAPMRRVEIRVLGGESRNRDPSLRQPIRVPVERNITPPPPTTFTAPMDTITLPTLSLHYSP